MDREFLAEYERQGRPEVFLGMTIRDGVLTNWQLDKDYDAFLRTCILPGIDPENCVFFPSIIHRIEMQSGDIKTQEYRTFILTDSIQDINPNAFEHIWALKRFYFISREDEQILYATHFEEPCMDGYDFGTQTDIFKLRDFCEKFNESPAAFFRLLYKKPRILPTLAEERERRAAAAKRAKIAREEKEQKRAEKAVSKNESMFYDTPPALYCPPSPKGSGVLSARASVRLKNPVSGKKELTVANGLERVSYSVTYGVEVHRYRYRDFYPLLAENKGKLPADIAGKLPFLSKDEIKSYDNAYYAFAELLKKPEELERLDDLLEKDFMGYFVPKKMLLLAAIGYADEEGTTRLLYARAKNETNVQIVEQTAHITAKLLQEINSSYITKRLGN